MYVYTLLFITQTPPYRVLQDNIHKKISFKNVLLYGAIDFRIIFKVYLSGSFKTRHFRWYSKIKYTVTFNIKNIKNYVRRNIILWHMDWEGGSIIFIELSYSLIKKNIK